MTHVAHLIPGIDRLGGAERQVLLLAKGMARRGWKVTLLALTGDGGAEAGELASAGVGFASLGMRKGLADPRGWLRMQRWLRDNEPDVLHAHLPHAVAMARLSRLRTPEPALIDTLHSAATGSASRRLLYRCTSRLTDRVTAVSRGVADAYESAGMIAPRQAVVVPNGVDATEWRPDAGSCARLRGMQDLKSEFLWLAVGRLEPVKNYPALLQAFALLPPDARLAIAGAGPLQGELRDLSRMLGVAARVLFLGFELDVRRWMQAADGFVLASRWEGLPMALLEAGACGLASVATDVAGSNEVIVDGETGFLACATNPESLQRAMMRLMQIAPANRHSMGMNARESIVQRFSLASVLDRWEDLYREVLEERAALGIGGPVAGQI